MLLKDLPNQHFLSFVGDNRIYQKIRKCCYCNYYVLRIIGEYKATVEHGCRSVIDLGGSYEKEKC